MASTASSILIFLAGMAVALLIGWTLLLCAEERAHRRRRAARALLTRYHMRTGRPETNSSPEPIDWERGHVLRLEVSVASLAESAEVHTALRTLGLHPYVSVRSRIRRPSDLPEDIEATACPATRGPLTPSPGTPRLRLVHSRASPARETP